VFGCGLVNNEETFSTEIADLAKLQSHKWKVILSHDLHFKKHRKSKATVEGAVGNSHSLTQLSRFIAEKMSDVSDYIPDVDVTTLSTKVLVKQGGTAHKHGEKEPEEIIDFLAVQKLSLLGDIVVSDAVAVDKDQSGDYVEIHAHLDEVLTASLLARKMDAQGLILLDKSIVLPEKRIWINKDTNLDNLVKQHAKGGGHVWDETRRKRLRSVFETVQQSSGWAILGTEEGNVRKLLSLEEGTFVAYFEEEPNNVISPVPYVHSSIVKHHSNPESWSRKDAARWLEEELHISQGTLKKIPLDGKQLIKAEPQHLRAMGLDHMNSKYIASEIFALRFENPIFRIKVAANPYFWPYNKRLNPSNTALVIIDMQNDFLAPNGYIAQMGYDVSNSRKTIAPVKRLAAVMRDRGFHIIWTREGHVTNLNDCYPVKYYRSRNTASIGIGDSHEGGRVLVRGEEGFDIVPELKSEISPTESIIDKLGKGSFVQTELETLLRTQGITNLIFCGLTTDVCVHTTMREAGDRGFECLLVTDATASLERNVWAMAIRSVQLSGGIFGATANSATLLEALEQLPSARPIPVDAE